MSTIVIGAGPHGIAVAAALADVRGPGDLLVVDPEPEPLAAWQRRATAIGMTDLRSPWVHHVGRGPHDLYEFLRRGDSPPPDTPTPPVSVFEAHAQSRWQASGIGLHRGRVTGLHAHGRRGPSQGWRITLDGGASIEARRVIVAAGLDPHRRARLAPAVPVPDRAVRPHAGRVAVIGGGHTAATVARQVLATGGAVDLFAPQGLRIQSTDLAPGWFGPKYLDAFGRCGPEDRLRLLRKARSGSTTATMAGWLSRHEPSGRFRVVAQRVLAVARDCSGVRVGVSGSAPFGPFEEAYEATGYRVDVSNLPWLAPHVRRTCRGLPVLDATLQAAEGLHLLGPLAELELGPAGRNLWGAMRAVERLAGRSPGTSS